MLDIVERVRNFEDTDNHKIIYVFYDTGLEYTATKKQIKYLENLYSIKINIIKAYKPIPVCCKTYGQPFISKYASEMLSRLQKHNFDFTNDGSKNFDELINKYPKCKSALLWWCNHQNGASKFKIQRNKWLKEFIISNPPNFKISNKCCEYAKKRTAKKIKSDISADLSIVGTRKAEGGVRSSAYKNCFSSYEDKADEYRPIFFYKDSDKKYYEDFYNIKHSELYSEYNFKRTGCCCCPYSLNLDFELEKTKEIEPKLYKAVINVFKDSYEYTKKYKDYCEKMDEKYGSYSNFLRR